MSKKASNFQKKVMSIGYRGKEIFKPLNTGWIPEKHPSIRMTMILRLTMRTTGMSTMIMMTPTMDSVNYLLSSVFLRKQIDSL